MSDHRVGQLLTFVEDPNPFVVQAISASGRWMACTRKWSHWDVVNAPEAAARFFEDSGWPELGETVYTMVDLTEELRGVDDAVGSLGYEDQEQCEAAVACFDSGEFEFSRRQPPIPLRIVAVTR